VDVGCGAGVGGLSITDRAQRVVLADVNERALRDARVNARLAAVDAEIRASDVLASVDGSIDVVIANPPYLVDRERRLYRDGGGTRGEALGVRMAREALARLEPGGTLVLYTGTAIVDGCDTFRAAVEPALAGAREVLYEELDPDVFGEELDQPGYEDVERIAAVGLVARR
jgi:methylase of polypeptide subunit release factors